MAYSMRTDHLLQVGTHAAANLASASTQAFSVYAQRECVIERIMLLLTAPVVSTGSVVCTLTIVKANGSPNVVLPTLIIPAGTAAGKVVFKDVQVASPAAVLPGSNYGSSPAQYNMDPGDQLQYAVSTAATTSGNGIFLVDVSDSPEVPAVLSNMIASA